MKTVTKFGKIPIKDVQHYFLKNEGRVTATLEELREVYQCEVHLVDYLEKLKGLEDDQLLQLDLMIRLKALESIINNMDKDPKIAIYYFSNLNKFKFYDHRDNSLQELFNENLVKNGLLHKK